MDFQKQSQTDESLQALSEIAQVINTIQEIDPLLEKVLEIAMETLAAERGFVLLKSAKASLGFEVKSSRNFSDNQLGDLTRISTSVVHEVLANGEPLLLFEAQKDPKYREQESIVLQKIQSIACVPLRIKHRQIGVIYLDSLTKRSLFTRENMPFLTTFANLAAIAIENAQFYQRLRDENRRLRTEVQRIHGFDEIIGQSPKMRQVFDTMSRVLDSDASVLIEGESGTGKELVARAIHFNGYRKDKPFMAFFCGSLPESLLESELFGHKKGAFTGAVTDKRGLFEAADDGTFFLDEIGDLSPQIQTKLLRVLQGGEVKRVGENQIRKVDVRIISATNKVLLELVKQGSFREDLYYRLNTINIQLPSLRERQSDIHILAHHFLDKFTAQKNQHIRGFDKRAIECLKRYAWPGNVRELENTVERAVVMTKGEWITPEDLQLPQDSTELVQTGLTLEEFEKRLVQKTLEENTGNISETARGLGVSRRWLHYKIKEWQLPTK
ncbi:sigma-54-dependent Fis family transcriptional regulator [candidate division KSB1 bacterium]|nr:sigma-54-dependent Fis family transcriptional regulator [candidate division KSB1 bacterium]NIR71552.1 sigma-54-dependent Fis family transcriptional regulator [candidate division KSB1 bacterium]NIS26348.1 sigma-54-dependent Fis family transcriptional regulator [candidate division KSB1 bacterium]NIT73115.1 sigma-54-dependent Fis family transcriptional regulator [candidate division KSB1 bacterium]NIU27031.1 sigma-54-dependent Fis family transcriptional regulator [candidate division KSB1 bacteri